MTQSKHPPMLKHDIIVQCTFLFSQEDSEDNETLEWRAGTIATVSNGRNLQNGNRRCRKLGAAEVRWNDNDITGCEEHCVVVDFQRTRFNSYEEHGWRLFFDAPWNTNPCKLDSLIQKIMKMKC